MNNKTIGVIIGAIVIVAVIGFVVAQSNTQGNPGVPSGGDATSTPTQTGGNPTSIPTSTTGTPKPGTYTLADVARHRTQSSCWTTIDGNVYDLTSWIPQHPGGEAAIVS